MEFSKFCSITILLAFFTYEAETADTSCGSDWEPYKDEKCFKIVDETLRTFDEAEKYCPSYVDTGSTLVMIHSKDEQDFLANYLFKTNKNVDNFWIGAKFSNNKFHWIDNLDLIGYTNWDLKAQRKKENYCVEMQADESSVGKWLDEPCVKKNLVVCQKMQTWSAARVQRTLLDARKQLRDLQEEVNKKVAELEEQLKRNISDVRQTLVPIGFVYAQLPSEKSPSEIWPWMTWSDVSATYPGLFFRVTGGDAASIGQIQEDNAPHFSEINSFLHSQPHPSDYHDNDQYNFTIPKGEWSPWLRVGGSSGTNSRHVKFYISGGEVRPRNMAMRVWKRTA